MDGVQGNRTPDPGDLEPDGYPRYLPADFMRLLGLSEKQARQIEHDYRHLLTLDPKRDIVTTVFAAGHDYHAIAIHVARRYNLKKSEAEDVTRLFGNVAKARRDQIRYRELGITTCARTCATCHHKAHFLLNGKSSIRKRVSVLMGSTFFRARHSLSLRRTCDRAEVCLRSARSGPMTAFVTVCRAMCPARTIDAC